MKQSDADDYRYRSGVGTGVSSASGDIVDGDTELMIGALTYLRA